MPAKTSLWSFGPSIYLPSLLYAIGQGAVLPVAALTARGLGASIGTAGLVVAMLGAGRAVGDIPAGAIAHRFGERNAMLGAVLFVVAALFLCLATSSVLVLGVGLFLVGLAGAVWGLARHAYLSEAVPFEMRARGLSLLGGIQRAGMFGGPFVGAFAIHYLGTDGAFWVHIVTVLIAAAVLAAVRDVPAHHAARALTPVGTYEILRRHLPDFRTLGATVLLYSAARIVRPVAVPLWADHLGLSPVTASLIYGITGIADMVLFYPGGKLMDAFGRRPVGIPCALLMGAGYLALPLTTNGVSLTIVATLAGVANGMTSGLIMIIGADLSPDVGRAKFLGIWRLCSDIGEIFGPLTIGLVAAATALGPAIMVMGAFTWLSAGGMARWLPGFGHGRSAPDTP